MKINLEKCIFSMIQQKENIKEFIVEVDDCLGEYLESLLNVIEKYNDKGVNLRKANTIEYGDFLVFTKNQVYIKKNYVCTSNKIYSLVSDYYKIKDLIKKLYKNNSDCLPYKACKNCPYYKLGKRVLKDILFDGEFIDVDEKVSVFNNFVKIGYDTYDIYTHHGKDLVEIDGIIYEIKSNDIFVKPVRKEKSICNKLRRYLQLYE